MLYQERYSSAYLSQAQSSLVQWGLDGKLRTILDTIKNNMHIFQDTLPGVFLI
jgi:hypothetical protein